MGKKIIINTEKAPKAIGPYEQAIRVDNLLFTSGQIPVDPYSGEIISEDIVLQTEQVIENIRAILEVGGSSLNNVIKTTIFLKDISDFNQVNSVYEKYFGENKPARSCVEVSALPKGALIEMEAIALTQ